LEVKWRALLLRFWTNQKTAIAANLIQIIGRIVLMGRVAPTGMAPTAILAVKGVTAFTRTNCIKIRKIDYLRQ